MKPSNWDRLQDIYHAALAQPESERSAFVEKACAGDPDLLRQVKSLLDAGNSTNHILDDPVFEINASDDLVGQTIGERYLVAEKLDGGGMSQVYVALDLNLQRQRVVIKVLSSELVQDSYARKKFEQEVDALVRIKHPNVVRVRDSGRLRDGKPYIVMDYVEGETLRSQINDGMDLKRAASILQQIGAALAHVHEKGIFHRDLKPENVMLTSGDDSVVLLDFGIAKVQHSLVAPTTVIDVIPGTLVYMSPEQLRGDKDITFASDIYSMGVVAYEMIFGERPFEVQHKGI